MDLETLRNELRQVWSAETSSSPEQWSPSNPAWGQCAVTALIIQDNFGGELLRCQINGISHYWNRLPDGTEVDFTKEQFPTIEDQTEAIIRSREYALGNPNTVCRYELLKQYLQMRRPQEPIKASLVES